jgi:hypothetical protein
MSHKYMWLGELYIDGSSTDRLKDGKQEYGVWKVRAK